MRRAFDPISAAQGCSASPSPTTTRQARREDLISTITAQAAVVEITRIPRAAIERKVQARLAAWHARLMGAGDRTREILREIFTGPIVVDQDGRFEGELVLGSLLTGAIGMQLIECARQVSNLRPPV